MSEPVLLRRASTSPGVIEDLAIVGGRMVDPASLSGRAIRTVDMDGRVVMPGLADHHIHLFATAAAARSVPLEPHDLERAGGLGPALRAARSRQPQGWLRGVGYDIDLSGEIDRHDLDRADVGPARIQDRTGIRWTLDSRGLAEVGLLPADDPAQVPEGVEVVDGRPTGRLTRLDHWLGHRVPTEPVDLAALGRRLASFGVTAVTDAGADNDRSAVQALAAAGLPQRLTVMTRSPAAVPSVPAVPGAALGPVKVLLDDADLPGLEALADRVETAHRAGRRVAVHCVTDAQLVLALTAGLELGDRIEHASFVPDPLVDLIVSAGVTVVVQPGLVATRGDRYLRQVDEVDHPALHRFGTLRARGVPVASGSDAPYGPVDPWVGIAAAVDRRTQGGQVLGAAEAVDPGAAVASWWGHPDDPGRVRTLAPGADADLVVLDADWSTLAHRPTVAATVVAGRPIHGHWP